MEKSKKVKITLGLFYLLVVSSFLYFFLSKFTLEELLAMNLLKIIEIIFWIKAN